MRKKEGNKGQVILDASIKVFAKSGYYNSKVAEIADLANVATGTVYVYYKDKEDLILKIFDQIWERLYNEVNKIYLNSSFSSMQKYDAMVDLVFNILCEDLNLTKIFVNEHTEIMRRHPNDFSENYEKFFQTGESIICEGMTNGAFTSELNVKNFRAFLFGGMRYLLQLWAANHDTYQLDDIRNTVKILTKNGLIKQ